MPRDLKPQPSDPRLGLAHLALGTWVIAAMEQRGLSPARFLNEAQVGAGLSAEAAAMLSGGERDGYLQARDCSALWDAALAACEREPAPAPALLTLLVREVRCASLGVLGFQMLTAPTLRAACDAFSSGFPLLTTTAVWTSSGCHNELTFALDYGARQRSSDLFGQAMFSIFLRALEEIAGMAVLPLRVDLAQARSEDSVAFERAIRSYVNYSAGANRLTFAVERLDRPLRYEHSGMHEYFTVEAKRLLQALHVEDDIADVLRRHLRNDAILTRECLNQASSRLRMSPRTLQRRLALAGTSFSDELEAVRRERAHQLVAFGRRPLAVVAHDLGFADCAAFSRAFRRWFAASPGLVRASYRELGVSMSSQGSSRAWEGTADLGVGAQCT